MAQQSKLEHVDDYTSISARTFDIVSETLASLAEQGSICVGPVALRATLHAVCDQREEPGEYEAAERLIWRLFLAGSPTSDDLAKTS